MKISTSEEKIQHPQSGLIPETLWKSFQSAVKNGHLSVLEGLAEQYPEKLQDMIAAGSYSVFSCAATNGHVPVLEYLAEQAPEKLQEMIASHDYSAFRYAAQNGHIPVLKYLIKQIARGKLEDMIAAKHYSAFSYAATNGHLSVLDYLIEVCPEKWHSMLSADHYHAFRWAAKNGRLSVLQYLASKHPRILQDMITADNSYAFRYAARNGHLPVLQYLMDAVAPERLQGMITAGNCDAFRKAVANKHTPVINFLLSQANVFAYAEQHGYEYGGYVSPFVAQKLAELRALKNTLEQESAYAEFDAASPEEARLLFYVLRHLIRQDDPELGNDMLFLIGIPAVKALAHQEVTHRHPNELLRIALDLGNTTAAELLLAIPAVRELAAQHNFYSNEQHGQMDLRALAEDGESSMNALTQREKQHLKRAIKYYQPVLKQAGVSVVMEDLRATLAERYQQNPATVFIDNQGEKTSLALPLDWGSFQDLHLDESTYRSALKAYYQHKDHCAWRYLSRPNPWMHKNAKYVNVNPDNTAEKWSTFEEYQPLISMLYLAVTDQTIPSIDHHTVETRLTHFINELALIGRAHNWDKTRIIADDGQQSITEEYDDLKGDRPSCFSGVKRRLFQSVPGHPCFTIPGEEIIRQEIHEFVRKHFKESIHDANREAVKIAWDKGILLEDRTDEDWQALKAIDISHEKLDTFIHSLKYKYGDDQVFIYMRSIQETFALNDDRENDRAHILKFGYLQPEQFLDPVREIRESQSSSQALGQFGIFAQATDHSSISDENTLQCQAD
ncbi:ankyrin repeat domain-containing protein [Legionella spiritensis]|uniref:Ankyrin repeat protein n=1 Tax=Legionella spiritensis TaxID=452 RepID=A0A0W0Z429_LEGSP|nr:ankyrin repeat domain-containing protein [Legionella spiritensis]KTD63877.1 ankyrin repeat protein [Legionella spiritensis]SNV35621.1 ankyrin repeat protein [Legionella spiritensis]